VSLDHSKGRRWIARKYWRPLGSRAWVFTDGEVVLKKMGDVKIVRHRMVRRANNPYLMAVPDVSMATTLAPSELLFGA